MTHDLNFRLTANETGETKCVVFVDSIKNAREALFPHATSVVVAFPFIKAFGIQTHVHKLSDLSKVPCVTAIAPHTIASINTNTQNQYLPQQHLLPFTSYLLPQNAPAVAIIDTGLAPHLDFMLPNRVFFKDFISSKDTPYDDNGHGTAVASILAGSGLCSGGKIKGVVPNQKIFALKAIGAKGEGGAFAILEAMQWLYDNAKKHNIKVVCMSFGSPPVKDGQDALSIGAEALWKQGIVVVASAGNLGPDKDTIQSPGTNSFIITVGGVKIEGEKIEVAEFSSRGKGGKLTKPDLVAPAVNIAACGTTNLYQYFSGTSMAAPYVAGIILKLLEKHPTATPNKIKEILLNQAKPLPFLQEEVGRGLVVGLDE